MSDIEIIKFQNFIGEEIEIDIDTEQFVNVSDVTEKNQTILDPVHGDFKLVSINPLITENTYANTFVTIYDNDGLESSFLFLENYGDANLGYETPHNIGSRIFFDDQPDHLAIDLKHQNMYLVQLNAETRFMNFLYVGFIPKHLFQIFMLTHSTKRPYEICIDDILAMGVIEGETGINNLRRNLIIRLHFGHSRYMKFRIDGFAGYESHGEFDLPGTQIFDNLQVFPERDYVIKLNSGLELYLNQTEQLILKPTDAYETYLTEKIIHSQDAQYMKYILNNVEEKDKSKADAYLLGLM